MDKLVNTVVIRGPVRVKRQRYGDCHIYELSGKHTWRVSLHTSYWGKWVLEVYYKTAFGFEPAWICLDGTFHPGDVMAYCHDAEETRKAFYAQMSRVLKYLEAET